MGTPVNNRGASILPYLSWGTQDPLVDGAPGEPGMIFVRVTNSDTITTPVGIYQKITTSGDDTNWIKLSTGGSTTILTVDGLVGAPELITALGGIGFTSTTVFTKKYIAGNGGPIVVVANPQVAPGSIDGEELTIQSVDAINTVELQDGNGLALNGPWIGELNGILVLTWDTNVWVEKGRVQP